MLDRLAHTSEDDVVRVWVPGCATGEEAYSIAIVLRECMEELRKHRRVQIFATDLDAKSIDVARVGIYPEGIAVDVGATRLKKFFVHDGDGYRVKKDLREMLVFAQQNLIADPPFTKLDLISCRNLLIYLEPKVQKRLLPLFHYALAPNGLLLLGSSESLGLYATLFSTIDKRWKVFRRKVVTTDSYAIEFPVASVGDAPRYDVVGGGPALRGSVNTGRAAEKLLLDKTVPPCVIAHERGEVVHIHGHTGQFLEPCPGPQTSVNIFNMAREGLQLDLTAAVRQANSSGEEIVRRGVRIKNNGGFVTVDLRVERISKPAALAGLFLITFQVVPDAGPQEVPVGAEILPEELGHVAELERELQHAKESHQATIEELETTNEELQSTNEELETSKEELQSLNEELQTVNAELQDKLDDLSRVNDDMRNLLNGTDIATLFLDNDFKIKRFTDQVRKVINVRPGDTGRFIGELSSSLTYEGLLADAQEVLRTLVPRELELSSADGTWYLIRIMPYRTLDNVIDGLVLTFIDTTSVRGLKESERRLQRALESSPTSVIGLDSSARLAWMYGTLCGLSSEQLQGKTMGEAFGAGDCSELTALLEAVLADGQSVRRQVALTRGAGTTVIDLYVAPLYEHTGASKIKGLTCVSTAVSDKGAGA